MTRMPIASRRRTNILTIHATLMIGANLAPICPPNNKPSPVQTKTGYQSTWPTKEWINVPTEALIDSAKIEVAAAMRTGKENAATKTGILKKPPPVPKNADMNPSTTLKMIANGSLNPY
jgi:hypothetical protein